MSVIRKKKPNECGAYGGNRILMTALQIIAANLAGIDRLIFHTVKSEGAEAVQQALNYIRNGIQYGQVNTLMSSVISQIVSTGFEWGESDGN
ncbi:MAG: hypothetical protein ACOYL3_17430 [Desulfuromonadaceae bacterium]